jgi:hypothetical protein
MPCMTPIVCKTVSQYKFGNWKTFRQYCGSVFIFCGSGSWYGLKSCPNLFTIVILCVCYSFSPWKNSVGGGSIYSDFCNVKYCREEEKIIVIYPLWKIYRKKGRILIRSKISIRFHFVTDLWQPKYLKISDFFYFAKFHM